MFANVLQSQMIYLYLLFVICSVEIKKGESVENQHNDGFVLNNHFSENDTSSVVYNLDDSMALFTMDDSMIEFEPEDDNLTEVQNLNGANQQEMDETTAKEVTEYITLELKKRGVVLEKLSIQNSYQWFEKVIKEGYFTGELVTNRVLSCLLKYISPYVEVLGFVRCSFDVYSDLNNHVFLKKLSISKIRLNKSVKCLKISHLERYSNLETLEILDTNTNDEIWKSGILSLSKTLKTLKLVNIGVSECRSLFTVDWPNLKSLSLKENNIQIFNQPLNMPELEYLDLSDCHLKDVQFNIFEKCSPKLKNINLSGNLLTEVPDFKEYSDSIETLDLSFNLIYSLNKNISRLKNLKSLNLSGNFQNWASSIKYSLNVSYNEQATIKGEENHLFEEINYKIHEESNKEKETDFTKQFPRPFESDILKEICQKDEEVEDEGEHGIEDIFLKKEISKNQLANLNILSSNEKLEKLDLSYNNIIDLPEQFKSLISLKYLNISNNAILDYRNLPSSLQQLNISYNLRESLEIGKYFRKRNKRIKVDEEFLLFKAKTKLPLGFPDVLKNMKNLVKINLTGNEYMCLDKISCLKNVEVITKKDTMSNNSSKNIKEKY